MQDPPNIHYQRLQARLQVSAILYIMPYNNFPLRFYLDLIVLVILSRQDWLISINWSYVNTSPQ